MKALPILATLSLLLAVQSPGKETQTGLWGDQGDGTFRNPILAGDYSDPDPIRVGKDYYMASSTFACSPGVTILHSRDLVNWETIGAAFTDLSVMEPRFNWDRMNRYSLGLYAPSLRYHDGKFWVFVNSFSGEGFYCCTALNPTGPWKVTQIMDKNGKPLRTGSWTDPCPFWDDDGKAYLASSRTGKEWFGYLFEMTPDGTQLLDADVQKMNVVGVKYAYPEGGTLYSPFHSTEGNKIYKRNGYYYLIHIEFLDSGNGRGTYVFRSRHIYGTKADGSPGKPGDVGTYEIFKFGPVGPGDWGEKIPGQGGLVDTPDGQWFWMAQFNHSGADGRRPTLTPVTWIDDWPVPGVNIKDKQGGFAWQLPKPIKGFPVKFPFTGDDFNKPALNPCWQWNHQPRADKWSLTERPGFLRLHAFKPAGLNESVGSVNFFKIGNVINQRHFRSELTRATFKLDLSGMADGQEAGMAHFNGGHHYASLGVCQKGELKMLKYEENGKVTPGPELPKGASIIWMRSTVKMNDVNAYEYSLDGETFIPFGGAYKLRTAQWRGDMVGAYTFNCLGEAGTLDVDSFQYEVRNAPAAIASATTYHVELRGDDANSGLNGSPWRTLAKACNTVAADQGHIIHVGEGTFTESEILHLKSGVGLIGSGSGKTRILVNHYFSLTDAVPNANPHRNTFPEQFILQMNGSNQVVRGFSLDGQGKRCHGGIFAPFTRQVTFEDLHMTDFRYSGLWVIEANDTILRFSRFKNNTYGNPQKAGGGGGDSGAVQYHRGRNLIIHDNHIEETGNLGPNYGGYGMKAQDRDYSVSASNVLEGLKVYNNVITVPANGAWEKGIAPAFAAEFLGMALKDAEIYDNVLNNTLSLAGPAGSGEGIRIHHNFFNIGRGRYGYGVEANVSNVEIDHNYFFGGLHPIAVFGRNPRNQNIHHNIFDSICAGAFTNRNLLQYKVPVANLRFNNNTIIDNGSVGQLFALKEATTFEIRNNLIIRPLDHKDNWGPEIPGRISHNFFVNITPRGENAMTGDPGITFMGESPLRPPYYTLNPDSPLLNKGEIISPLTDGFTGSAPDIGAIEDGVAFIIPGVR